MDIKQAFGDVYVSDHAQATNIAHLNAENVYMGHKAGPAERPWSVPRSVNRLFIGRDDVLKSMASVFHADKGSSSSVERVFVIAGLGGTGKSEICLKFAEEHRNRYWGIFWVDCSSSATILQGFERIGKLCGLEDPDVASVRDHLSSNPKNNWLLILDNADDVQHVYSAYFPSTRFSSAQKNDIIVTTRNPELCQKYGTLGHKVLDQLEPPLARDLLLKAANIPNASWASKLDVATGIVEELGYHTLAILHAGSFIANGCEIEDYLDLFNEQRSLLLKSKRDQEYSTYGTVHQTFEISANRIQQLSDEGNDVASDALSLLGDLSFFHTKVPLDVIAVRAVNYLSALEESALKNEAAATRPSQEKTSLRARISRFAYKISGKQAQEPDLGDLEQFNWGRMPSLPQYYLEATNSSHHRLRWHDAIRMLNSFSFVTQQEELGTSNISLHPLVHAWARERMDYKSKAEAWWRSALLLALSCAGSGPNEQFPETLRSQLHTCIGATGKESARMAPKENILSVLCVLGHTMYTLGEISKALHAYDVAAAIFTVDKTVDLTSKSRLRADFSIRTWQATCKQQLGFLDEALEELEALIEREKKLVGEQSSIVQWSKLSLGILLVRMGRTKDAINLLSEIIEATQEFVLNEVHVQSQYQLGIAYLQDEQVKMAIEQLELVAGVEAANWNEEHRGRLLTQYNLAIAYWHDDQLDKAAAIFEHVLRLRRKTLGEEDFLTLETQDGLARVYYNQNRFEEAIKLSESVVEIYGRLYRKEYSDRLRILRLLADAYKASQQDENASRIEALIQQLETESAATD